MRNARGRHGNEKGACSKCSRQCACTQNGYKKLSHRREAWMEMEMNSSTDSDAFIISVAMSTSFISRSYPTIERLNE